MPRYIFYNPGKGPQPLPPPLSGVVKSQRNFIVDTEAANVDTPAMKALLNGGFLTLAMDPTESPTIPNGIEVPVVSMLVGGGGSVTVGPTPPGIIDGTALWVNTNVDNMVFHYDIGRSKWLSVAEYQVYGGRNGTTPQGSFYRGEDGMVLDSITRGISVPNGTLTSLSICRTDTGLSTLQVVVGGVVVAELPHTSAGSTSTTVNANFNAGVMGFRNKAGSSNTQNVQIVVRYRRR